MYKKIQYKFQVDREAVLNSAKSKNVEFSTAVEHTYTYFKIPSDEPRSFVVLRIKISEGKQKVDMKIRNNESGEWEHFESDIGNAVQMQAILEHIGCKTIFTFHKSRQTWIGEFIRLDLDTTKELGTFLEVKFDPADKNKAEAFLRDLGVDPNKHDKRSVIEIYLKEFNKEV